MCIDICYVYSYINNNRNLIIIITRTPLLYYIMIYFCVSLRQLKHPGFSVVGDPGDGRPVPRGYRSAVRGCEISRNEGADVRFKTVGCWCWVLVLGVRHGPPSLARLPVQALLFSFSIFTRAKNILRCHCRRMSILYRAEIVLPRAVHVPRVGPAAGSGWQGAGSGARESAGRVSRIIVQ
jgi:hypothetical protein